MLCIVYRLCVCVNVVLYLWIYLLHLKIISLHFCYSFVISKLKTNGYGNGSVGQDCGIECHKVNLLNVELLTLSPGPIIHYSAWLPESNIGSCIFSFGSFIKPLFGPECISKSSSMSQSNNTKYYEWDRYLVTSFILL